MIPKQTAKKTGALSGAFSDSLHYGAKFRTFVDLSLLYYANALKAFSIPHTYIFK